MTHSKPTAIVTGAAKRIGSSIALKLSQMGYHVVLHYNTSAQAAEKLCAKIEECGGSASTIGCDFADVAAVEAMMTEIGKGHPGTELLVNNASIFEPEALLETTAWSLEKNFRINFQVPVLLTRDFAKIFGHGQVINLLDTNIGRHTTKHFGYLLSKKALAEFTQMAAVELGPRIRVNAIAPGLILPPEDKDENYLNKRAEGIPLKRKGSLENIAQSLEFLISNDFLTGQIIYNDGGEQLI